MSTRKLTVTACAIGSIAALILSTSTHAVIDSGSGGTSSVVASAAPGGAETRADGFTDESEIVAIVEGGTISTQLTASGSPPSGPACNYSVAQYIVVLDLNENGVLGDPGERTTSYRDIATRQYVSGPGPGVEVFMERTCADGSTGLGWVRSPEAVDINVLIAAAYERVSAQVPNPTVNISPRPEVGVPAQLGIWLAIDDPGQLNVVAQVGMVWASVTASLTSLTWDMGNGASVACDGLGTPYPIGADTYEQGPCGYTYTRVSDVGLQTVTVTANWSVRLITSTGRDEALDPVTSSTSFDYDIYEIVTVIEG